LGGEFGWIRPVFSGKRPFDAFYLYSDFGKLFLAAAIRNPMKPKYAFLFVLNVLISVGLAFTVVALFAQKEQKVREIQELQDLQRAERQKAIKAREEGEVQKQFETQVKQESQKQSDARKIGMINDNLDKIDVRLKKVLDEPSGYADETKSQRDTQEELLRQLAHCARTEIGLMVGEMQNAGFTNNAVLQENLNTFFRSYEDKIHDDHMSYDYIDLGLPNIDHKKQLDVDSANAFQSAIAARRAIHNLKQKPK
jgi:hypothetical protein